MNRKTNLVRAGLVSVGVLVSATLHAAAPGLPFTEDFADTTLNNSTLTNANWSVDEQAAFLAWSSTLPITGIESSVDAETDDTRSVALGDVDNDGDLDLIAGNGSVAANMLYLYDGSSFAVSGIPIGLSSDNTQSVVLGDVNGDGHLDIVAGNAGQVNRVYLNNGSGVFSTSSGIGSESDATNSISLGDIDGDGDLDVVVGNAGQSNRLYFNNGSGGFSATGTAIGSSSDNTTSIVLLDADSDGDLDLAVANNSITVTNKFYANDGTGVFSLTGTAIGADASASTSITAGDVDGDGDADLVVGNDGQLNLVYFNVNGAFGTNGVAIGSEVEDTTAVSLRDYDGDGDLDLFVGNKITATSNKRYLNNSNGVFSATGTSFGTINDDTFGIALGDIDSDGDLDVITGNKGATNKLILSDSRGSFAVNGTAIGVEKDNTMAIVMGDIDGVNGIDVIAGNAGQTNKLYLNDGSGGFPADGIDIGSDTDTTYSVVLADVNGDGDLDLIAGNWASTNKLYLNDGSGGFLSGVNIGLATEIDATTSVVVGLVNADAFPDVIVGNWGQANKLYLNDGSNSSTVTVFPTSGTAISSELDNTRSIALGDVDGANGLDLAVGNSGQTNKYYLNNGSGVFPASGMTIGSETDDTRSIVIGDVDGGNGLDLIAGNSGQLNKLYLNDGTGSTLVSVFPASGAAIGTETDVTTSMVLMNVDSDTDLDLLVGNDGENSKRYLNDGSGGFSTNGTDLSPGNSTITRSLAIADVDGDGDDDLFAAEYGVTNKLYRNIIYQTDLGRVVSQKINSTKTNIRGVFLTATATVNTDATRNTWIDYYLTNNGGVKWHKVLSGKVFTFPDAGTNDLRWKAEMHSLSPARTPVLSGVTISANNPPEITSNGGNETAAVSVASNQTAVTTVKANDDDGGSLAYGIIGGTDAAKFSINLNSGALTFITAPNFDVPTDSNGDNVYHVRVMVEDTGAGNPTDTQDIFVTVTSATVAPGGGGGGGGGANSAWWLSLLALLLWRRKCSLNTL